MNIHAETTLLPELNREGCLLTFAGDCVISHAQEGKEHLLAALEKHTALALDVAAITQVDLSFCQLLLSLQKTAQAIEKTVVFRGALPPPMAEILQQAGLSSAFAGGKGLAGATDTHEKEPEHGKKNSDR